MSDILINDIFNSDAFAVSTLAAAVNELPYVPGQVGRLGIFEEMGVATSTIALERNQGVVSLVSTSPRGSASKLIDPKRREMRNFTIPHLATRASIPADSLRNVRAFGSNQLRGLEEVRNFYMQNHMASLDATVEYGRIGAVKGNILDADGSTVIYNLFTEFGLTQDSTDFALNTTTTDVLGKCTAVLRNMDNALGGSGYERVVAFCGDTFYDSLRSHANVKQFFINWQASQSFTQDFRYRGFPFGEILFINYRGSIGGVGFVPTKEAYAVPVGVPGLFKTVFGPADYLEAIGQLGLPRYAKAEITELGKGIEIELQTNPLSFCVRPQVLQKMTTP